MGTACARRIAGRMSVMIERKKEERRITALWSKMKTMIMMKRMQRRRRIAKGKQQQKQQFPYTLRPHTPRGLKHSKYARVERCGTASEIAAKSGEETANGFLPFHIMADNILPRLPVKSLARFRSVCKQWRSLIYSPCFAKVQIERSPETESPTFIRCFSPYLNEIKFYNFIKINDGGGIMERTFTFKFGGWEGHTLSNSINGLVCAVYNEGSESERSCTLFNPTTREVLPLPKIRISANSYHRISANFYHETMNPLVFGFDVSSGEYKLVYTHNIDHRTSKQVHSRDPQPLRSCAFKVLTVGTQEWRYVGETPCWVRTEKVVYLNGALHWLTVNYNNFGPQSQVILAFDMKDEKFRFISFPQIIPDFSWRSHLSLQKLKGHICLVFTPIEPPLDQPKPPPSLEVWSLEDYAKQEWKLAYDVDMSRVKRPYEYRVRTHIVDVVCRRKLLIQRSSKVYSKVYSHDIRSGTWYKLIGFKGRQLLHVLTESLISPSNQPVL